MKNKILINIIFINVVCTFLLILILRKPFISIIKTDNDHFFFTYTKTLTLAAAIYIYIYNRLFAISLKIIINFSYVTALITKNATN